MRETTCPECARLREVNAGLLAACKSALPAMEKALAVRRQLIGDVPGGIAGTIAQLKAAIADAEAT